MTLSSATRSLVRLTAELAVTLGLILAAFVFYLLVWTGHQTAAAQSDLLDEFHDQAKTAQADDHHGKKSSTTSPKAGDGLGVLHIPALGKDWAWVVVEGVEDDDIAKGPGHFPGTAMPGEIGNFAIAGHRSTHGEPFAYLDKLQVGDSVVMETVDSWYVYKVTWERILSPTATEVTDPVAGHPGQQATQRTMTLVTCNPRWGSSERMVFGAQLVEKRDASAGPPTALG